MISVAACFPLPLPLPLSAAPMFPLLSSTAWSFAPVAILPELFLADDVSGVELLAGVDDPVFPVSFCLSFFVPQLLPQSLLLLFCSFSCSFSLFPSSQIAFIPRCGFSPGRTVDVDVELALGAKGGVLPAGRPVTGSRPTTRRASASRSMDPRGEPLSFCCGVDSELFVEAVGGRGGGFAGF